MKDLQLSETCDTLRVMSAQKRTRIPARDLQLGDRYFTGTNTAEEIVRIFDRPNNVMRVNGRKYKAVEFLTEGGWTVTLFEDDKVEVLR